MRRLIDTWRGTVVADEQDFRGDHDLTGAFVKMLNQGFQRGKPIVVCDMSGDNPTPQMFEVFGPKLLVTRRRFPDDALESRCFTVQMYQRTRTDIPRNLLRSQFDAAALALRNKLLRWRFERYRQVQLDPLLAVEGMEDRLNQIGIPLLSTVSCNKARSEIVAHLKKIHSELIRDWADSAHGMLFECLQHLWRDPDVEVSVGNVAEEFNRRFAEDIDRFSGKLRHPVSPRKIGSMLRDGLGLETQHTREGRVVVRNKERMDSLEQRYSVQVEEPASCA